ncbi:MAG: hypothetical protein KAR06_03160 [Deltaproteobacteria bacterium]|nr:hypothetical protein [Deltaproteobacteria bacterium]
MDLRKLQATADAILRIPLINKDGSQAVGESANLSTKIIDTDGTALIGYTEATFSEPNNDGVYVVKFPSTAANKAFTLENQANPYTVTLDSSTADVEPTPWDVWISDKLPWEFALETTSQEILAIIEPQGNRVVTIHVEDGGALPIPDVFVRITDAAGLITLATGTTDASGDVTFALNDGDYQAILRKAFVNFTVPELFTVTADETFDFVGDVITPSAPTKPDTCVVYGVVIDNGGNVIEGADIFINETDVNTFATTQKIVQNLRTTSDVSGFWELEVVRSSALDPVGDPYAVTIKAPSFCFKTTITVPDQDSVEFSTIVGT